MASSASTLELPRPVTLLDGGMGEELRARSPAGDHPLWSAQVMIEAPEIVRQVHAQFIEAGADVITTNSYSTIRRKLAEQEIEDRFTELNRLAGKLAADARDATGRKVLIAGSLPPLFGSYRPDRIRPFAEIEPLYREQAEILAPFVDLFLCETMSSAEEARAAASAAAVTGKPVWVAWTLADDAPVRLRSGESIRDAADALDGLPVGAILANCCAPEIITQGMPELLAAAGDMPTSGYGNGFIEIPADWQVTQGVSRLGARTDLDPDAYLQIVRAWIEAGARIVGGCCRIGPEHIARIGAFLRAA